MKKIIRLLLICTICQVHGQGNEWHFLRPDNTGIGGDYHQVVTTDCHGDVWTAGYLPFYSQGSVTRLNDDSSYSCWGNYDGFLPADRVYDMAFDHNNGLWVATNDVSGAMPHGGIAHFDGNTWTTYTSANTPLPEDDMRGITVDGNNHVWATFHNTTTNVGGFARFDGSSWTIYTPANSLLPTPEVDKIKADAQNNIWIGTSQGIVEFDGTNWNLYLPGSNITDVEYDASTQKLYAASGNAINVFNGVVWNQINSTNSPVSANNLWCMDAHGDTLIIGALASVSGCWIYNGTTWSTHPATNHVYDVRMDRQGNFWRCGIGYVEKYNGTSWIRYTRFNTGLADYFTNDLFVDSQNRKWVASGDGGIQVFDCPRWEDYGLYNEGHFPSPQNMTSIGTSVTQDSYGDIWMTYDGTLGYAVQIPGGNYSNYGSWIVWDNTNAGGTFQSVQETAADDSGNVFFRLYNNSVQMYSHRSGLWTNWNAGNSTLPTFGLQCMTARAGGKMYFGGLSTLSIYDNGSWATLDLTTLGLPVTYVNDIAFDGSNNMWLATEEGLHKYNGISWTTWNESNSNLAANHVTSIEFGAGDTVYIGAHNTQTAPYYGGLSVFDGVAWTSYLEGSSPIAHKQVEDLERDTLGNLWVLTQSEGITIYRKGGVRGFECIDKSLAGCQPQGIPESNLSKKSLMLFPNPCTTTLNLIAPSEKPGRGEVRILDIYGKTVIQQVVYYSQGKNLDLNISGLSSGIYFCELSSASFVVTAKFIKLGTSAD